MGYKLFSTANADYAFNGVNHFWARRPLSLFEGVDAVVTECAVRSNNPQLQGSQAERVITTGSQYFAHSKLIDQIRQNGKPLFSVDVDPNEDKNEWYGEKTITIKSAKDSFFYSFVNREIPDEVIGHNLEISVECRHPLMTGRSSLAAYKIETGLVPLVARTVVGRKPKIGLIYGAQHMDLIRFLQDAALRKEMTDHFAQTGYKGLVAKSVNEVVQYIFHPTPIGIYGCWTIKRSDIASLNQKAPQKKKHAR